MPVDLEPAFANGGDYALQIDEDLVIGAANADELEDTDFLNHSCEPNAGIRGQIVLAAMRDIAAGEEITFDYATVLSSAKHTVGDHRSSYGFDCRCSTPSCRGRVTDDDWRIPELQRRYAGWFSLYLEKKIEREREVGGSS